MPRGLAFALSLTDFVFLLYWSLSGLAAAALVMLPPALMYAGYDKPSVCAWNWSFLPLEAAFSVTGVAAVVAARRGLGIWRPLALVSLP